MSYCLLNIDCRCIQFSLGALCQVVGCQAVTLFSPSLGIHVKPGSSLCKCSKRIYFSLFNTPFHLNIRTLHLHLFAQGWNIAFNPSQKTSKSFSCENYYLFLKLLLLFLVSQLAQRVGRKTPSIDSCWNKNIFRIFFMLMIRK